MQVTDRTEALYETASESERLDPVVSKYFGLPISYPLFVTEYYDANQPVGQGWITLNKYVTPNDLRLLALVGVQAITAVVGTRRADFQLNELGY